MSTREFSDDELARTVVQSLDTFNPTNEAIRIARRFGLTLAQLVDRGQHSRARPRPAARAQLYRLLRSHGWSYPAIGRFVGGRDHTTVMLAIASDERRMAKAQSKKEWHAKKKESAA